MKKTGIMIKYMYFTFWTAQFLNLSVSAYIDPTTTAMLIQIIAGIFITLGVVFGVFRHKIVMFFKGLKVKSLQKQIAKTNDIYTNEEE